MNFRNYIKNVRLKGKKYFTLTQAISDLNITKAAALAAIHRLKNQGDLISPAQGLYVIIPPENQSQGCIPPDVLTPILMTYIKADYYVSLLSAAQYYGASHQKPACFQIISNKRLKHSLDFGYIKIELIYKKSLASLPTKNITVPSGYLKVATPELVAFDLLSYPLRSGGLNHIATVLSELAESLNVEALLSLADISGEKAWLQRLGYILEVTDPIDSNTTQELCESIEAYLSTKVKTYVPLAPEMPRNECERIKKWMIIINTEIESDL